MNQHNLTESKKSIEEIFAALMERYGVKSHRATLCETIEIPNGNIERGYSVSFHTSDGRGVWNDITVVLHKATGQYTCHYTELTRGVDLTKPQTSIRNLLYTVKCNFDGALIDVKKISSEIPEHLNQQGGVQYYAFTITGVHSGRVEGILRIVEVSPGEYQLISMNAGGLEYTIQQREAV